jgi:DtxR family Mn-dependent transcriptional regulator
LEVDDRTQPSIADLLPGEQARIARVSDSDPEMLKYLTARGIGIGDQLELVERQPFDGPCAIRIDKREHSLGVKLAQAIHVERV